jgi:hypothetical protein
MKLPVWLFRTTSLVSVLLPTVCFAYWWGTWPARTSHEYCELIQAGKFEDANRLLDGRSRWAYCQAESPVVGVPIDEEEFVECDFRPYGLLRGEISVLKGWFDAFGVAHERRTAIDIAAGRECFTVGDGTIRFVSERGHISVTRLALAKLVDGANRYHADGRFEESEILARCAYEMDPDSPAAVAALYKAKIGKVLLMMHKLREAGVEVPERHGCLW